ncbi:MAG: carbamoyltransferase HypF [Actinobacteria bacterium]|nr:carbamoyltransferase HypF [Actinomycetota bacterium]
MNEGAECRVRFEVAGIVHGVGFRPFVHGHAARLGLGGFVRNDSNGVVVEVQGSLAGVGEFRAELTQRPPPLAVIDQVVELSMEPAGERGVFRILHSEHVGAGAMISPDVATCDECLAEMWDPANRRYRYAFTNCTNCGPRFTISTGIPYDRFKTTMAAFEMCARCRAEYEDPLDRRFHAQPVACPACGPHLRLLDANLLPAAGDAVEQTASLLLASAVVAVKGLGGYHLACLASSEEAVRNLRGRKAREEKPLAVMVADLDQAAAVVHLTAEHGQLLTSRRRPIVLMDRLPRARVAPSVAPANRHLGVMLPYTPLHHLLLEAVGEPLVMTSGNLSDEPIAYRDEDAFTSLDRIADAYLTHNRDIHMRCDDSVVRLAPGPKDRRKQMIRRARGYAPEPIGVTPAFKEPILAAGPELKHTFCIGSGARAILSHHIGDLENWEAMSSFVQSVEHYQQVFEVRPKVVAYDLHPEYLATKWAMSQEGVRLIGVQHHHAHIASCLVDNRRDERVVGLALDGTGYGDDGTLWGCEVLVCDLSGYERYGHLKTVALPGGAAAVREPWRMAALYLQAAFGSDAYALDLSFVHRTADRWKPILHMARTGLNSPISSSAGRLFDAASCLLVQRDRVSYEGQAAIELEQLADPGVDDAYPCTVTDGRLDGTELISAMVADVVKGAPGTEAAAKFHNGFAAALVEVAERAARDAGVRVVALSGGTFQNQLLTAQVLRGLSERSLEVLTHSRVPANDGGISLGQAAVANRVLTEQ